MDEDLRKWAEGDGSMFEMAKSVGEFYCGLVETGVPQDAAVALTMAMLTSSIGAAAGLAKDE